MSASNRKIILPDAGGVYLRLAWRNLWRSRKRTLIAVSSIFFAVVLAVLMQSMTSGSHEYMIDAAVKFSTGHLQVHGIDFWEKRSLDQSILLDSALLRRTESVPHVITVVPRLETFALVSHGTATKISPVMGIDNRREDVMASLGRRIVRGVPLPEWHHGAIIAEGLATRLHVDVGDSVVVYGQGFHGVTAAGILPVTAVARLPFPDLNNAAVFLPLGEMQSLCDAPGRVTTLAILADGDDHVNDILPAVTLAAGSDKEVMTWRIMMPELVQAITVDSGGTLIMLLILYIVIGFGIFGTVMMMTTERRHEFGVTIALGMKRWRLMVLTTVETLIIALIGAVAGMAASIPVVLYLARHPVQLTGDYAAAVLAYGMEPVVPFSTDSMVFLLQGAAVFLLALISATYPILVLRKLDPVQAMRR